MDTDLFFPYSLTKKDIKKSGIMFAKAFEKDPVWNKVFNGVNLEDRASFFESPARYGLKFGTALASSGNVEGAAVWLPGEHADMTFMKMLRSGFLFHIPKIDSELMRQMNIIFAPLKTARHEQMAGSRYIYLFILGVAPEHQGMGIGVNLLQRLTGEADQKGLPVYLETATQKNIKMYEKRGFRIVGEIMQPIIDLPQWAMLREPKSTGSE